MTLAQLEALAPSFDFKRTLPTATRRIRFAQRLCSRFLQKPRTLVDSSSLDDLKSYLTWHYVTNYATELSKPFVDEDFDFYQRYLNGTKELQPRWKRCVQLTDRSLGDAVGPEICGESFSRPVERTHPPIGSAHRKGNGGRHRFTYLDERGHQSSRRW